MGKEVLFANALNLFLFFPLSRRGTYCASGSYVRFGDFDGAVFRLLFAPLLLSCVEMREVGFHYFYDVYYHKDFWISLLDFRDFLCVHFFRSLTPFQGRLLGVEYLNLFSPNSQLNGFWLHFCPWMLDCHVQSSFFLLLHGNSNHFPGPEGVLRKFAIDCKLTKFAPKPKRSTRERNGGLRKRKFERAIIKTGKLASRNEKKPCPGSYIVERRANIVKQAGGIECDLWKFPA